MEDTVSRSSVDSLSMGDEYVMVNADPCLKIADNGDISDLEKKLSEVLSDDHCSNPHVNQAGNRPAASAIKHTPATPATPATSAASAAMGDRAATAPEMKVAAKEGLPPMVGETQRDHVVNRRVMTGLSVPPEGGDDKSATGAKSPSSEEDSGRASSMPPTPGYGEDDCIVFQGVTYLGSATVNAPRSEMEINRNMAVINDQSQMTIDVALHMPMTSEGTVRLMDPVSKTEIASFRIHHILFCARGPADSEERCCFAFTCSHGDNIDTAIFQCHVFRCHTHDLVGKILYSFAMAFRRLPKSPSTVSETSTTGESLFRFNVALEFKEDDSKGNFHTCPKDKNVFKLRCNVEKKIVITVQQISNKELKIERCFGLLVSPGRNVKHSDMHLIDMAEQVSTTTGSDGKSYIISGHWDPTDPSFQILNTETPKDMRVFMTIAIDLVIEGIQEPVRFLIETKAKIYPMNERFWYFNKKPHHEQFVLRLTKTMMSNVWNPHTQQDDQSMESSSGGSAKESPEVQYEVVSVESQTEIDRKKAGLSLALSPSKMVPQDIQTPQDVPEADESDGDEPLLSGSGVVSKDVTDENLLEAWHEVLTRWHQNLAQRPRQVQTLARKGIPEALRGEVWQLLAGCSNSNDLLEAYRILISKDSPCEGVILRDINRTFPAHDFFKETGGVGQDSLYKISKAYSVYDEEVGYCQGLSFLAAALLLHMPEEQAFCVLVKIMFHYNLRDLFKQGFEELHLKFFQLERLMQDQIPDLFNHFVDLGLEAHMFASQWFLTLFTAKFPLFMVFHILDLFLCDGRDTIFNVALALLKTSRKDLLALDFEGVLKYFRVQLPKKYRAEENARDLLQMAISLKISSKKLKKYEKEYISMKEQEMQHEDPIDRFERENKRLLEANMRLEQENDDLAHQLVTSKIALRNDLDNAEDRCEVLNKELLSSRTALLDLEEEKRRLETEASQLKDVCRRELDRSESESSRNNLIIADYKQICSQLSERLEKQQASFKEELERIKHQISNCDKCGQLVSPDGQFKKLEAPQQHSGDMNPHLVEKERIIRELELELAQTKLALVESECKTQDLTHQLNSALTELQASKNTWFQKTLTSIRDVTTKKGSDKGADKVTDKAPGGPGGPSGTNVGTLNSTIDGADSKAERD